MVFPDPVSPMTMLIALSLIASKMSAAKALMGRSLLIFLSALSNHPKALIFRFLVLCYALPPWPSQYDNACSGYTVVLMRRRLTVFVFENASQRELVVLDCSMAWGEIPSNACSINIEELATAAPGYSLPLDTSSEISYSHTPPHGGSETFNNLLALKKM